MQPLIEFEHVSKRYWIGAGGRSLRVALTELSRRLYGRSTASRTELWALRDVSFQVQRGESVGILGHNGAGKTTVLKLLAGITLPTSGSSRVRGRLGSLIELGAGFHPEMTGRENVYLNGVILGMTRKEVARRFDSIVDFAEIGRFIDTPVKRYSSGMYVRLAFAVAAHIDPEILLVDEVLAVGDIGFRAKCYRRMAELRENGTSVLLVSHNVNAVRDVCDRVLLLWEGKLVEDGPPDSVICTYLACMEEVGAESASRRTGFADGMDMDEVEPKGHEVEIKQVAFRDETGRRVEAVESGKPLSVEIGYQAQERIQDPIFRVDFYRHGSVFTGYSTASGCKPLEPIKGHGQVTLRIDGLYLPYGTYSISVMISRKYEYALLAVHHQAYTLQVLRADGTRGQVMLPHQWRPRDHPNLASGRPRGDSA